MLSIKKIVFNRYFVPFHLHFRVYDEALLRHVWRIGATPCALPPTGTDLPFLNSLGDTAVDFDIAPPRVSKVADTNTSETINSMNVSVVFNLFAFETRN